MIGSRSATSVRCAWILTCVLLVALPILAWYDRAAWLAVRSTLLLALGVGAIALPLGTALALLVVRTDLPGRGAMMLALGTLLLVPLYLQAAGWDAGFGRLGWHSMAYGRLAEPLLDGWRAAVWIHAAASVPWVALIVGLAVAHAEPELEEQSLLDAGPARVFFRLTLRRSLAGMAVAAAWILVSAAGEMAVTNIYQVSNVADVLHVGFRLGDTAEQAGMRTLPTLGVLAGLVMIAVVLVAGVAPPGVGTMQRGPYRFPLDRWKWPAALATATVVVLLAGVPLANLCYQAGAVAQVDGGESARHWSASEFARLVGAVPYRYREEIGWTLLIGALSAALSVSLAAPLAWWARGGKWRWWLAVVPAAICWALPGPLIGLGVIALLNRGELPVLVWLYDRTVMAPVLAMTIRSLPLCTLMLWYSLRFVPDDVLDAAATEGAGPLARFWRIVAPQRVAAGAAAFLAAAAISMGDVAASILVTPPGVTTVAIRVFGLIHYGVDDQVAALSLVTAVGSVAMAVAAVGLARRALRIMRTTR
jgi:iron(III) transport system permease protein